MTAYKTWVKAITTNLASALTTDITGSYGGKTIAEITAKTRLNETEFAFPRIDIVPTSDRITDKMGVGGSRMHEIGIDVVCGLSSQYTDILATGDVVDLTGDVYDSIQAERAGKLTAAVDDVYIDSVDFNYAVVRGNVALYCGVIHIICLKEEV